MLNVNLILTWSLVNVLAWSILFVPSSSQGALHGNYRSLKARSPPPVPHYSPDAPPISPFPFSTCDNDEQHSQLRLYTPRNTANADGSVTYCWNVNLTAGTQCDVLPNAACCQQDLSAIWIEMIETCAAATVLGATINGMAAKYSIVQPYKYSKAVSINFTDIPYRSLSGVPFCLTVTSPCRQLIDFCRNGYSCIVSMFNQASTCCPTSISALMPPAPPAPPTPASPPSAPNPLMPPSPPPIKVPAPPIRAPSPSPPLLPRSSPPPPHPPPPQRSLPPTFPLTSPPTAA
ncbi:hypothetical protein CEUSTIGMA_g2071.t1, partial [Chlamydomonas eustigma]